jgi:hypothetical protein
MEQMRAHFRQMAEGQLPHCKYYYIMSPQEGSGDVKLVTPTEVAVNQAKSQIKRKLSQIVSPSVKRMKKSRVSKSNQTGAGKKKKKKQTGIKKRKVSKSHQTGAGNTSKRIKKTVKSVVSKKKKGSKKKSITKQSKK